MSQPQTTTSTHTHSAENYVLNAPDVLTASRRFEEFLAESNVTLSELPEGFTHRKDRMRLVEVNGTPELFLKRLRDGTDASKDAFCDLTCGIIAEEMDLPTPRQRLVRRPDGDIGLLSRFLGGTNCQDLSGARPQDDLANSEGLRALYVFEAWVNNTDDKLRHFWSYDTPDGPVREIVDHGHTLHRRHGDIDDLEELGEQWPNNQAGTNPQHYGVDSMDDVENGLAMVESVTDAQIETWVDWSLRQFTDLDSDDSRVESFREEVDHHREVAVYILTERQDRIRELVEHNLG